MRSRRPITATITINPYVRPCSSGTVNTSRAALTSTHLQRLPEPASRGRSVMGKLDPLGKVKHLTKPLIVVAHGDAWNMGHELVLDADIRVAAADVRFGQDENTHGRFPGGGSTVRFVRDAGWATP